MNLLPTNCASPACLTIDFADNALFNSMLALDNADVGQVSSGKVRLTLNKFFQQNNIKLDAFL